jgi:hypothetical protein
MTVRTIAIAQDWQTAVATAEQSGYVLNDAGELECNVRLLGFYLDLPGEHGLLVCHNRNSAQVDLLEYIDNWSSDGSKETQVFHDIRRFELHHASSNVP